MPVTTTSAVDPSISSKGNWLAFTELEENWNVWRVRLTAAGMGKPELLLSSTGKNHSPSYSPDGRQIAFVSDRSGSLLQLESRRQPADLEAIAADWRDEGHWAARYQRVDRIR